MKTINANYAFVFYDVNEKRVQKVFKVCKKYLSHYQKSVFRGTISPSKLIKLEQELRRTINAKEDFVTIIK
ncbi:MAG: CRISPR-associated endonuclease Cas2, partial [Sporolactobacillus sp.]